LEKQSYYGRIIQYIIKESCFGIGRKNKKLRKRRDIILTSIVTTLIAHNRIKPINTKFK
jgi:hypothetical protein